MSVRRSGCTDVELLEDLIERVYLPLYPNVAPITTRDEEGNFLSGPVVFKTDSGQGRLANSWEHLEFRERMGLGIAQQYILYSGARSIVSGIQGQDQEENSGVISKKDESEKPSDWEINY